MPKQRAITEREVRRAAREGKKILDVRDAIVTPGAREVARQLGILLTGADSPTPALPRRAFGTDEFEIPPGAPVTVAIAADHAGVALKETIEARLYELGHRVSDLGPQNVGAVDYADFAIAIAREVAAGRAQVGVMIDGSGIGSCMAANKVRGVRAALCWDTLTAAAAREHANANVLTLGAGLIGPRLAVAIVETFLAKEFAGGRHTPRVAKIDALQSVG